MNTSVTLPKHVAQWVACTAGPGSTVAHAALLPATSSTVYEVQVETYGRSRRTVLRLFTDQQWLENEPDLAEHEAAALKLAQAINVPTPQLLGVDPDGRHCAVPAVLMSALPGSVELPKKETAPWLRQLAAAAAVVHTLSPSAFPWHYRTWADVFTLRPPVWSAVPEAWQAVIERTAAEPPATTQRFIHRDYHPTNILWQQGTVSGIVDWVNACWGPAGIDVAHCRLNLVCLYGLRAAERFLEFYQTEAGSSAFEQDPYWDAVTAIEFLPGPNQVYPPWSVFGRPELTRGLIRERLDTYAVSIAARLTSY